MNIHTEENNRYCTCDHDKKGFMWTMECVFLMLSLFIYSTSEDKIIENDSAQYKNKCKPQMTILNGLAYICVHQPCWCAKGW